MSTRALGLLVGSLTLCAAQSQPLLTTIAGISDLTTFAGAVNASGGNRPNPAFEERFNSLLDRRNYSAFVPTNAAFAKVPEGALQAFLTTPAYELFEAIIRTHIAEGSFNTPLSSDPIIAIEGFPLIASNANNGTVLNGQAFLVGPQTRAANGFVQAIDQVLNPFTSYFGISNATEAPVSTTRNGSVYDYVRSEPALTAYVSKLGVISPRSLERFGLVKGDGSKSFFALPSNDAFAVLPSAADPGFVAPSNRALSEYLLTAGFLGDGAAELDSLDLHGDGTVVESFVKGLDFSIAEDEDGVVRLNNAAVTREVRLADGVVWLLDRVPDVLFEVFGPESRTS